jgi:hypothetical protein
MLLGRVVVALSMANIAVATAPLRRRASDRQINL